MASGLVVCTIDEGLVGDGPKLLECASVLKMSFEFIIVIPYWLFPQNVDFLISTYLLLCHPLLLLWFGFLSLNFDILHVFWMRKAHMFACFCWETVEWWVESTKERLVVKTRRSSGELVEEGIVVKKCWSRAYSKWVKEKEIKPKNYITSIYERTPERRGMKVAEHLLLLVSIAVGEFVLVSVHKMSWKTSTTQFWWLSVFNSITLPKLVKS